MASWNSVPLEITYEIFGWLAFVSWSISFYPQVILNFRRKRVVGLNFDFVLLNLTKHSSYMIYNVCLYFSPFIQKQYFDKYGSGEMIPVATNDVAFSIHAVLLTAITLFQIAIYDRGTQKVSKISIGIVSAVWLIAAICFFIALPSQSWLWLISIFKLIDASYSRLLYISTKGSIFPSDLIDENEKRKNDLEKEDLHFLELHDGILLMAIISNYSLLSINTTVPRPNIGRFLVVMNFARKSTDGFSIENILLDFTGGLANYAQMVVQSIDQNSWVNFYGNIGKTLLSLVSVFFDIIFMCQHYVLYPARKAIVSSKLEREGNEPLVNSVDGTAPENV